MRALIALTLLFLSIAAPAHAGNLLDLAVVDRDTGATLRTYAQDGKLYVAGTPGHRYAVRLRNRSGARVLAVVSVDGVNAVTGETAGASQNGYVLDAWQSTEINGWRKSLDEIAQFNFTSLPDSYAAQTGRPINVGVIGVAVFTERQQSWSKQDMIESAPPASTAAAPMERASAQAGSSREALAESEAKSATADSAVETRSPAKRERLGTGHGEREWSRVASTHFDRASSQPAEQLAIWYDSYANLAARGIIPQRPIASSTPNPFPNSFVADPPYR